MFDDLVNFNFIVYKTQADKSSTKPVNTCKRLVFHKEVSYDHRSTQCMIHSQDPSSAQSLTIKYSGGVF